MDNEDFGPFRVPLDLADGVTAEVTILLGADGEMTVSKVMFTAPEGGSVTGEHLRTTSLPSAYAQAREAAAVLTKLDANYPVRPTTGRWSGISDDELARYASAYLLALRRSPNAPVKIMMGTGLGSEAKIRDRLKACRTYGWLIGARQGHAGAVAGPRLIAYRGVPELSGEEAVRFIQQTVEQATPLGPHGLPVPGPTEGERLGMEIAKEAHERELDESRKDT